MHKLHCVKYKFELAHNYYRRMDYLANSQTHSICFVCVPHQHWVMSNARLIYEQNYTTYRSHNHHLLLPLGHTTTWDKNCFTEPLFPNGQCPHIIEPDSSLSFFDSKYGLNYLESKPPSSTFGPICCLFTFQVGQAPSEL